MPNMSKPDLSVEQRRFIEEMAALLVPWGMQPSLASLYGYLLLCDEPVSLDAITATLGMAKSSASVAARALEQFGLARRHAEPGSKRVRFGASTSYSGFIAAQAALMGDLGRLIEGRARTVSDGETLRRLRYLGSFNRKMETTILGRISELSEEFVAHGPDDDLK
jgi:DNA-binding MarR family transcriptional regulator